MRTNREIVHVVKGGQGRSDEEILRIAARMITLCLILGVASIVLGLVSLYRTAN